MYLKQFGLQEKPFHITPNPKFIFLSKNHKEAFAHLLYGVKQGVGFLSLIGEVGTGKTTVLRTLLRQLEQSDYQVALIFNPCLSALELLQTIHREFGIACHENEDNLARLHDSLNRFLLEQRQQGKTVVLVIDEAQNLEPVVLEQLRLLSNLETETDKLLQLIIVGQPELEEVLDRRELRQLKQRLTVRYRLTNMDAEDTALYVRHRLKVAGFTGGQIFTDKALAHIYRLTAGLPRLINILCDRALLVAYTNEQNQVDHKTVRMAQSELAGEKKQSSRWPLRLVLAGFSLTGLIVLLWQSGYLSGPVPVSQTLTQKKQSTTVTRKQSPQPAETAKAEARLLPVISQKIGSFGEVESVKLATSAVLALWGRQGLETFNPGVFRPLETALRTRDMSAIRFQGSRDKLLRFNTPAILSIVLPNLQGKRYLAVLEVRDSKVKTAPALTEDGWMTVSLLGKIWFGKAVIPWRNYEQLPYLDRPGMRVKGVRRIQELLSLAGYPDLKITGVYDLATITAVSQLQKNAGLAPDGRIGAQTLFEIYRLVGLKMPRLAEESRS